MPIGCLSVHPVVVDELYRVKMRNRNLKILDLGIGMGIYGPAVRQWLDQGVRPWTTYLMGVEGFAGYRNPCWQTYDWIHVMRIEEYLSGIGVQDTFDAILLLDVLEHFTEEQGHTILELLMQKLNPQGVLIVSTPGIMNEQGAAHGNELEIHRHEWNHKALEKKGFRIITNGKEPDFMGNYMLTGIYTRE